MRQRIIRLISIAAVMAGIIVVAEYTNPIAEEPETVEISESVGSEETVDREETVQEGIQEEETWEKDIQEKEIRGKVIQKEEILKESYQKTAGGIFTADSAVVDLGNHKVAYLTTSDELAGEYGYEDWIVFQKLNQGSVYRDDQTLYIPAEGTITAISADDFNIQITAEVGQEVRNIQIPVCFMLETDYIELLSPDKKAVLSSQPEVSSLPEIVWTETIGEDEKYEISFERISVPYTPVTFATGGKYADYRLTVRDMDGKAVQELILENLFILYEDIYWLIDIDGNGFLDLVFCAYHILGQENSSTTLDFLIWNNDKKMYEEKPFPKTDIQFPKWNTQKRTLMFMTEEWGNYWARGREMYCFDDGDWRLYARLIPSSDEEPPRMYGYEEELYYKTLDYYYRERRYESGEMIGETIMEEAPYEDEQSIWYEEGNQELFPRGAYPWGTDEVEP